MLDFSNVNEGEMPFKYFGVPPTSQKTKVRDFKPLIMYITAIHGQQDFCLFARKIELIQSIIFSIQNYWALIFDFPTAMLYEIDLLCMKFLWKSNIHDARQYLVAWEAVCRPKKAGGLGLSKLIIMNVSLMM